MSEENCIPISDSVLKSPLPQYFHPLTGTPYREDFTPLACQIVIVGWRQSQCVHAVLLDSTGVTSLDTGERKEYTDYKALGVSGICKGLDFQGATLFRYYLDPSLTDITTVLADLLVASRPGALCTQKVAQANGNVYVPDYLKLFGVVHVNDLGLSD